MNRIYILLIILSSLLIWRPVLNQVPMGEGYYYFDKCQNQFIAPSYCPTTIWQYDNLARVVFQFMIPVFGDNLQLYMFAELVIIIFVYLVFYVVLSKITKNNFFAFSTVLIFTANYTGSFSMMAIGNYQRFVQRVPNLIPLFISFYFLTKFFDTNKLKNLLISLLIFIFSIFMAHHSIFMLPLFIIYIALKFVTVKISLKSIITDLVIVILFLLSTLLFTKIDQLAPKTGIINYAMNTPDIVEKTFLQIPNLMVPTEIVRYTAKHWPIMTIPYPFTFILKIFALPVFLLLLIPFFIKGKNTDLNILIKTSVIALPIVCFLNLYAYGDGAPHPLRDFGEDRIYFIASIYSSIILGYFLTWLWDTKKKTLRFLSIMLMISFVIYNNYLINRDAIKLYDNSRKMESFINYVHGQTINNRVKTAIIGPSHLLWPMQFVILFYNTNEKLVFALDSSNWNETMDKSTFDKIKTIDYLDNNGTETDKIVETQIK